MSRFSLLIILCLFIYFPTAHCIAINKVGKSIRSTLTDTVKYNLIISGKVLTKKEVWDRRTNSLMGRPDFLKEIIFSIEIDSVFVSDLPNVPNIITASVKDNKLLVKHKTIPEGEVGIFKLQGNKAPFILLGFDSLPGKTGNVIRNNTTINVITYNSINNNKEEINNNDSLSILIKKSGKEMLGSKLLQQRAVYYISKKYLMKNAEFVSLTSFSGPCPPQGGYVYWGVRGIIKNKWYVWQQQTDGKLREGKDLDDPLRYQKCNSPDSKILTPSGSFPVNSLKVGDSIISSNNKVVSIIEISKVRAGKHRVCRITFADRTVIEISPGHPLADGRLFGDLKSGDIVTGKLVVKNKLINFKHEYTWDILPDSPSGTYFICGIEIASTIKVSTLTKQNPQPSTCLDLKN